MVVVVVVVVDVVVVVMVVVVEVVAVDVVVVVVDVVVVVVVVSVVVVGFSRQSHARLLGMQPRTGIRQAKQTCAVRAPAGHRLPIRSPSVGPTI